MATKPNDTMDLNLKAYPNELTQDVDNDYTVKVDTQSTLLTQDDLAARLCGGEPPIRKFINQPNNRYIL